VRKGLLLLLTGRGLALGQGAPEDPPSKSLEVVVGKKQASQHKPSHIHMSKLTLDVFLSLHSCSIWISQGSG